MIQMHYLQNGATRQSSFVREVAAKNFVLYVGHLGRREPVVQPATSQAKEVALMRRILLVLTVALIMAAMLVASAMPALAQKPEFRCTSEITSTGPLTSEGQGNKPVVLGFENPAACTQNPI